MVKKEKILLALNLALPRRLPKQAKYSSATPRFNRRWWIKVRISRYTKRSLDEH